MTAHGIVCVQLISCAENVMPLIHVHLTIRYTNELMTHLQLFVTARISLFWRGCSSCSPTGHYYSEEEPLEDISPN